MADKEQSPSRRELQGSENTVAAERKAAAVVARSELRFRSLFERAGVGMTEIDSGWRILRANAVYCQIAGRSADELIGGSCLAFTVPDDIGKSEAALRSLMGDGPDAISFEKRYVHPDGSIVWIRSNLSRVEQPDGTNRFLKIVEDITDRKAAEARLAALIELGDRFRDVEDPADLAYTASEILGRTLSVSRVGYGEIDPVAETITIVRDWTAPGIKSLAGELHFRDYGNYIDDLKRGETVIFADAEKDPRTAQNAEALKAISAQAVVNMPVTEQGGFVALLYLNNKSPREWTASELDFIRDVADRTRTAVERRRVGHELRLRGEELQTLADNIPALAWMAYASGDIFWYNRRWYEYTGTSAETQMGWGWESVHHPDVLPEVTERWTHSLASGEPFEMIFPLRGADGEFRQFLTRIVPIRDDNGAIVRWFGTNVDVTEQAAIEDLLREESHNLEILNRTGAAVAGELDLERVVQMVTDAGVDLTGAQFGAFFYNLVDDEGESYTLFTLSGADRAHFERFGMPRNTKVFAPTFDGEGVVRSDDITKDPRYGHNAPHKGMPEGHLPVRSYLAVPVIGRTGEVIGGLFFGHPDAAQFKERHERLMVGIGAQAAIAIDNAGLFREAQREIQQRVSAEQALTALNETLESRVLDEIDRRAEAEDALRQAQKMETVGQLSGGIAHDFNNLLQVIQGNLSLLQHSLPDNEKWARAVKNALTGTERAAALTRRLLAFSRRQSLDPRPVDLNRFLGDMSELLRRTLGETVTVDMKLDGTSAVAEVDPNQLENSILNLAINARDAMPDGGTLTIATKAVEIDEQFIKSHPDAPPGHYICVSVRDTGEGMDAETLERAVEPFFTTKEVGRGTGLGLSMVYGFVRQSGGYLAVESKLGKGSTLHLYLPRAERDVAVAAEEEQEQLQRGNGELILLCEDDDDVRQFSAESLQGLGYRVVEAGDANSALERLRECAPVDLLFTDVVLPGGKTGADLAREARILQPGLKILFTTGYARTALDETVIEGGVEVLPKPFSVNDLAERIARILR